MATSQFGIDSSTFQSGNVPPPPETTSQASNGSDNSNVVHFIPLSDAGFSFISFMLTVDFIIGSFVNALCLFVFASNKQLRSPTNIFVMSLNLCDFLMCFVGTPMAMTSAWNRQWMWGDSLCDLEAFIVYFLGLSSMYILMAIAFDRYIAISKPLLGHKITKKVALVCCVGCFGGGAAWSIFPLMGWNEYGLEGAGISCSVVWESTDPIKMSYIYAIFFWCLIFPVGVMIYSYGGVMGTLRSLNKTSVWDDNSRVARRNLAIEKKMLKTSVLIVASFLGCWMPYTVVSLVTSFGGLHLIPPFLATVPPVIAKSQGLLNPLIYVATNKQFRSAFAQIVPCDGLKKFLTKEDKAPEEEAESEESDMEDGEDAGKSKKSSKKDGNKSKKNASTSNSEKKSEKKSSKKEKKPSKNAVHNLNPPERSEDEGVSEISNLETPVPTPTVQVVAVTEASQSVTYTANNSNNKLVVDQGSSPVVA